MDLHWYGQPRHAPNRRAIMLRHARLQARRLSDGLARCLPQSIFSHVTTPVEG
jgi:hypothetical protein